MEPTSKESRKAAYRLRKLAQQHTHTTTTPANDEDDDGASLLEGGSILDDSEIGRATPDYEGWRAKYKIPLKACTVKGIHKKCVTFLFEYRVVRQTRAVHFDSEQDAMDCVNFIESQKKQDEQRRQQKFEQNSSGLNISPRDSIHLLVEIVGATDLPAGDLLTSDPYVWCFFNHKEVHKTKHIIRTLDPIWTLKTKGLFILEVTAEELFQGDGLHLAVMDFDTVGKDERLGTCQVDARTMYDCNGERLTFDLEGKGAKGTLAIRVRHATAYDRTFMKECEEADHSKGHSAISAQLKAANTKKGGKSAIHSIISRNVKTEKVGMGPPVKMYRIRPGPDPKRVEETTWMTLPDMKKEVLGESREWIDAGSGSLGRIFVEVLSCQGLPNLDTGGFTGNLTDAFASLVFEDTGGQTDIIDDDLNPKWMPWSKRAFIFHMYHASSELFIGIFDYDGLGDHDLIGRVAVNISNLQPDTLYTLTYKLYRSGKSDEREPQGEVTLRLRMEIDDDRKLLLSCLEPPKTIYVNVKDKKDFKVLRGVCNGAHDTESYSLNNFLMYLDELQSYEASSLYLTEAAITLFFWRGHHPFAIRGKTYLIPLHSMAAFVIGIVLVERPQFIPSFYFMSIAWLLFATQFFRRHQPNPWHRCKSFTDIFVALVWGDSFPPARIEPNQDEEEVLAYEKMWNKKIEDATKRAAVAAKDAECEAEEAEAAAELIGDTDTDITTKVGGHFSLKVDILKPYLEPYQVYLVIVCRLLRYVRNVVLWEECYLSFWLTLGCMVLSVVSLFVPWFFFVRWTSRIIIWTVFGPWMKLADIYYWTPIENMTLEEIAKQKEERKKLRQKYLTEAVEKARIERERAQKLKAMKKFLFGKFIMKVPVLKEDRHCDFPLPESSAVPYSPKPLALAELAMKEAGYHRIRIPGQHLEGDMIPTLEANTFTEAPVGQATKKHAQAETDTAAYAKVGSLVAGAAVITYYGIPAASSVFSSIFGS